MLRILVPNLFYFDLGYFFVTPWCYLVYDVSHPWYVIRPNYIYKLHLLLNLLIKTYVILIEFVDPGFPMVVEHKDGFDHSEQ